MSTMITEAAQLQRATGWDRKLARTPRERDRLRNYIAFQMASAGLSTPDEANDSDTMASFSTGILNSLREKNRLLAEHRAPIDSRIEGFLQEYFRDLSRTEPLRLPSRSLTLDRHGMARELSLPVNGHSFQNELVNSYRCLNGVLNNPRADRRTTAGTFHVAEGGLAIPRDKRAVPRNTFVHLFHAAMQPPKETKF